MYVFAHVNLPFVLDVVNCPRGEIIFHSFGKLKTRNTDTDFIHNKQQQFFVEQNQ